MAFQKVWRKDAPRDKVPITEVSHQGIRPHVMLSWTLTTVAQYAWISLTYVLAMLCSNSSLQYVDYPTQVT